MEYGEEDTSDRKDAEEVRTGTLENAQERERKDQEIRRLREMKELPTQTHK